MPALRLTKDPMTAVLHPSCKRSDPASPAILQATAILQLSFTST